MEKYSSEVVVIGAGIVGISTAYYLKKLKPDLSVILVDGRQPMTLTSAQSGENYRNWWPHPIMTAFTDHSIDLMETIACETGNRINMNRRGYALATRKDDSDQLLRELYAGYAKTDACQSDDAAIRIHGSAAAGSYQPPVSEDWQTAPAGVDVLSDQALIRNTFPGYASDIKTVVHIRRAGSISAQQMGQHMLDCFKAAGGVRINAEVQSIQNADAFRIALGSQQPGVITAERIVNAAGPFINKIANMLGTQLPVKNTLQQKIAFEDKAGAISRQMPFSIDLDAQFIDWSEEDKALFGNDAEYAWLADEMPGAIHCRPDGGDQGSWIKLGWAFNDAEAPPVMEPAFSNTFPEIVLRGAARLNPSLKPYYGQLPRSLHHYGGYYTLTDENWPLIGAMEVEGTYVAGAMSGFGTMAACASGELCAQWVTGSSRPAYARALSLQRYADCDLMEQILGLSSRGIL